MQFTGKIALLSFLLLVGAATARRIPKPDISIGLNLDHDTATGSLGGAVPRVRWDTDQVSVAGYFDVQGGIDATLTDVKKVPDTYVWGEAKRINKASAIALRGDMNANEPDAIDLNLRINGFRNNLGLQVLGSADFQTKSLAVDKVMASTSIDKPFGIPGSLKINPRYDVQTKVPDATVGYSVSKFTSFKADAQQRRFTLAHTFGKKKRNQIVPTLSTQGKELSISYSRDLQNGSGRVTTTWTPDDSVALKWSDGDWDATIRAPLEGCFKYTGGSVKFSMKRNVGLSLY